MHPFEGLTAGLGLRIAEYLAGPMAARGPDEFDEFAFLRRSAASPTAAPLLSTALHAGFVTSLARHLGGKDAPMPRCSRRACLAPFQVELPGKAETCMLTLCLPVIVASGSESRGLPQGQQSRS